VKADIKELKEVSQSLPHHPFYPERLAERFCQVLFYLFGFTTFSVRSSLVALRVPSIGWMSKIRCQVFVVVLYWVKPENGVRGESLLIRKHFIWKLFSSAVPWRWTNRISQTTKLCSC
jgi:hypothetical protein